MTISFGQLIEAVLAGEGRLSDGLVRRAVIALLNHWHRGLSSIFDLNACRVEVM